MSVQQPPPNQLEGLVPQVDPLITRVSSILDPRIDWFRAGDEVDTFIIRTERFDFVIDTMCSPVMFEKVMALAPLREDVPTLVVMTHADYDHHWGNSYFEGRNHLLIASEASRERVLTQQAELDEMNAATEGRFASVRLVTPHVGISAPATLDGGDLTIRLVPTPGHTPDHLALYIPELGIVFAGDTAERPLPEIWESASLPLLRASLQTLVDLNPTMVVPSHGGTTDVAILADNLRMLEEIERRVSRGETTDDLIDTAAPDKRPFALHCLRRVEEAVKVSNS